MHGEPIFRPIERRVIDLATEWVKIGSLCRALHVLPSCGGLLDQEPRDLDKLLVVINAISDKETADLKTT